MRHNEPLRRCFVFRLSDRAIRQSHGQDAVGGRSKNKNNKKKYFLFGKFLVGGSENGPNFVCFNFPVSEFGRSADASTNK